MTMTDGPEFCPHEDRDGLAEEYLARRLSEEQAEAFEAHYFACDACFEAVELATSLHGALAAAPHRAATPRPEPEGRAAVRRAPRFWALAAAAAAILLFALPGLWLLRLPGRGPVTSGEAPATSAEPPVFRGARDGFEVTATRSGPELLLEWPAVAEAGQYEVRISSVAGETLWEKRTAGTRLTARLDELPAGAGAVELFVRVEALDGLLQPVAQSRIVAVPGPAPAAAPPAGDRGP